MQGYENEGIGKCRDENTGIWNPGMTSINQKFSKLVMYWYNFSFSFHHEAWVVSSVKQITLIHADSLVVF